MLEDQETTRIAVEYANSTIDSDMQLVTTVTGHSSHVCRQSTYLEIKWMVSYRPLQSIL